MGQCQHCGASILFGGVNRNGLRFCKEACANKSAVAKTAGFITDDMIYVEAEEIRQGQCPVCSKPGPIDLYWSHRVISVLVMTYWKSTSRLSCKPCATKAQLTNLAISGTLGWWGFPHGIIITPIQVFRNIMGLTASSPQEPSEGLKNAVRTVLAQREMAKPGSVIGGNGLSNNPASAGQNSTEPVPEPIPFLYKLAAIVSIVFMFIPILPLIMGIIAIIGTWNNPSKGWRIAAYVGTALSSICTIIALCAMKH